MQTITDIHTDPFAPPRAQPIAYDAMRWLSAKTMARTDAAVVVAERFETRWPSASYSTTIRLERKASVPPGGVDDPSWAGALALPGPSIDIITSAVRRQSVPVRAGFRLVPFDTAAPVQIGGRAKFAWGRPKPVSRVDLDVLRLPMGFLAAIPVFTDELVKLATPGSEAAMQDIFIAELVMAQDADLLDPAVTLIAGIRPASLTHGLTPIAPGTSLNDDVAAVLSALYTSRPGSAKPTLIMSPVTAGKLAATGAHPALGVDGGRAFGVPVVTTVGAANQVVAVDAAAVAHADGGVVLDVSREAALQMDDAPMAPDAATVYTSLWQMGLAAFKLERTLWWQAVPGAVQVLTVTP